MLRGGDVVVLGDHDAKGYAHQEATAAALVGVAARVRVLKLANHWPGIGEGQDISDWLGRGDGTREGARRTDRQGTGLMAPSPSIRPRPRQQSWCSPPPNSWPASCRPITSSMGCFNAGFFYALTGATGAGKNCTRAAHCITGRVARRRANHWRPRRRTRPRALRRRGKLDRRAHAVDGDAGPHGCDTRGNRQDPAFRRDRRPEPQER